ncbi:MAG: hypothetical protein ACXW3O_05640 [Brevundimonas sp.]
MHRLHRRLAEDDELSGAVASLDEYLGDNPLLEGLVLEYNPFWAAAHHLYRAGLDETLLDGWRDRIPRADGSIGRRPLFETLEMAAALAGPVRGPFDVGRRHPVADDLTRSLFGQSFEAFSPYLLRVLTRPGPGEFYDRLLEDVRKSPVAAMVEARGRARLVSAPGSRVRTGRATGTLGGYLRDQIAGETYAVTCGHVFEPRPTCCSEVSLGADRLAPHPVHALQPLPLARSDCCRRGCAGVTRADVALLRVTGAPVANLARSFGDIDQYDLVQMTGAVSRRTYEVGGACVWRRLGGACWDELYDLRPPGRGAILAPCLRMVAAPPPNDGDSGAWLVRDADVWSGMVVGADAWAGYALAADRVVQEADAAFGMSLVLA